MEECLELEPGSKIVFILVTKSFTRYKETSESRKFEFFFLIFSFLQAPFLHSLFKAKQAKESNAARRLVPEGNPVFQWHFLRSELLLVSNLQSP